MIDSEHAPAKLNLALHVRGRRADGRHDIETIFAFAGLGDTVTLDDASGELAVCVEGPFAVALGGGETLVGRAARALADAAGVPPRGRLRLTKRLPVAAGLGGGSADAAAALRLLARVWGLGWARGRLAQIGQSLGADVPACVHARAMRGEGLGERLTPVALGGRAVVLVNAGVPVPTGRVFAAWDGVDRGPLAHGDALAAALAGRNDLEAAAIGVAPVIGAVLAALAATAGARLVRMSGSGGTCFATYDDDALARAATVTLGAAYPSWWIAGSRVLGA